MSKILNDLLKILGSKNLLIQKDLDQKKTLKKTTFGSKRNSQKS